MQAIAFISMGIPKVIQDIHKVYIILDITSGETWVPGPCYLPMLQANPFPHAKLYLGYGLGMIYIHQTIPRVQCGCN